MDSKALARCIAKAYKNRNVYLTTEGPKRDRKDLIKRNRDWIRDAVEQLRVERMANQLWLELFNEQREAA